MFFTKINVSWLKLALINYDKVAQLIGYCTSHIKLDVNYPLSYTCSSYCSKWTGTFAKYAQLQF